MFSIVRVHNYSWLLLYILYVVSCIYIFLGGYIPRDAPIPEVQGDNQFEIITAAIATSLGVISTIYFLMFNIYYRNNL